MVTLDRLKNRINNLKIRFDNQMFQLEQKRLILDLGKTGDRPVKVPVRFKKHKLQV
jgi:hypothetical protein